MAHFLPTNEDFKDIAKIFGVREDTVKTLYEEHQKLQGIVKEQYPAHTIRFLEEFVRKSLKAPFFQITCHPFSNNPKIKNAGCASYYEKISFNITYDSSLNDKDVRVIIAHELGHLFLMTLKHLGVDDKHEPLSSILGIFMIMDKNEFYANKTSPLMHASNKEIINDFSQLANTLRGTLNLSGYK